MSQVRVAKGIPNQPLLRQTRFSNSLAKQKNTKKYLRPKKKIKNTNIQLNMTKLPSETEGVEPPQVPSIHVGRPLRVLNVVLHHGVQRSDLNSGHTQKIHEQLLNPPLKLRDPHNNPHMH